MPPGLFKICLLGKLRIIDYLHQNYFQGKYAYWGKLESSIRNSTRTISTESMPNGEN